MSGLTDTGCVRCNDNININCFTRSSVIHYLRNVCRVIHDSVHIFPYRIAGLGRQTNRCLKDSFLLSSVCVGGGGEGVCLFCLLFVGFCCCFGFCGVLLLFCLFVCFGFGF